MKANTTQSISRFQAPEKSPSNPPSFTKRPSPPSSSSSSPTFSMFAVFVAVFHWPSSSYDLSALSLFFFLLLHSSKSFDCFTPFGCTAPLPPSPLGPNDCSVCSLYGHFQSPGNTSSLCISLSSIRFLPISCRSVGPRYRHHRRNQHLFRNNQPQSLFFMLVSFAALLVRRNDDDGATCNPFPDRLIEVCGHLHIQSTRPNHVDRFEFE